MQHAHYYAVDTTRLPTYTPDTTYYLEPGSALCEAQYDEPCDQDVARLRITEYCRLMGPDGPVTDVAGVPTTNIRRYRYVTVRRGLDSLVPSLRYGHRGALDLAYETSFSRPAVTSAEPPTAAEVTEYLIRVMYNKILRALTSEPTTVSYTADQLEAFKAHGLGKDLNPIPHKHVNRNFMCLVGTSECASEDALPSANKAIERFYKDPSGAKVMASSLRTARLEPVKPKRKSGTDGIVTAAINAIELAMMAGDNMVYADISADENKLRTFMQYLADGGLAAYSNAKTSETYQGLPVYVIGDLRFAAGQAGDV